MTKNRLPKISKDKNKERQELILKLYYKGKERTEILEIIELTTDFPITQNVVDNVIREYKAELKEEEFDVKRIKSLERSKQRLQDENNFLRRQVRNVNKDVNKKEDFKEVMEEIVKSSIEPVKIKVERIKSNTWRYFSTTDWHLGKNNTADIIKKIGELKEHILSSTEENITLAHLGDLWENLSQQPMHSGQHLHMEYLTLKDNIDLATWIFYNLIDSITKKKNLELVMVWWNHDRLTSKNDDDYVRSGMFMLVQILEAKYSNNKRISIVYNEKNRIVLDKKDLVLDLWHWEFNFNKDKLETIRQKWNMNTDKHIIRNSGHRHTLFVENAKNITRVITPSLAWEWDYDSRLDLNSNCGYTTITTRWKNLSIESILFS